MGEDRSPAPADDGPAAGEGGAGAPPRAPAPDARGSDRQGLDGVGRFGARAALGWSAVVLGAVPFLALWLLVEREWAPLAAIDGDVAAALNAAVRDSPLAVTVLRAVTDLGGAGAAVLLFVLTTVFLLVRQQRRLAAFAATTGMGLAVLGPVTKAIVDRARPIVEAPVADTPSNASFPSGHSMTALVTFGALLLLSLPGARRRARPWLVAGTVLLVVAVGFTRLALGVHFVSDVLAGWALGAGWLAVTVGGFRVWQHSSGVHAREPLDPLDVEPADAPQPAPTGGRVLPSGRTTVLHLALAASALWVATSAVGLLVTGALADSWPGRADRAVVEWFVDLRSDSLTTVMEAIGTLAGTRAVLAVGVSAAVLALAVTASWRPVVFVVVTVAGEVLLYFLSGQIVGRLRPDAADLTEGLPTGASWPSGHAAAAAALYGAAAVLVISLGRSRWRWSVLALPVLLGVSIAVSRIYVAAHFPSDTVAGLLLGGAWVLVCARAFAPLGGDPAPPRNRSAPVPAVTGPGRGAPP